MREPFRLLSTARQRRRPVVMLEVGDVAPDFLVKDHLDRDTTIRQFRGKKIVLWFYPKANTPGCTAEGCGFRDLHGEYETLGVVILGCSFDTVAENAAFVKKYDLPYSLLCDADREVGLAYQACDAPNAGYADRITYVIDEDGFIVKAFNHIDARAHPAKLLEILKTEKG
jgi:peroxiredoxin Q/BCP